MSTITAYAPAPALAVQSDLRNPVGLPRFSPTAATGPVPGWSQQPARRVVGQARLRLTRRGRLLVLALVLATFAAVFVSQATPSEAGATGQMTVTESVIVQPGDTLWDVAVAALPEVDPREAVQRVRDLNGLTVAAVRPGQRLVVPAGA